MKRLNDELQQTNKVIKGIANSSVSKKTKSYLIGIVAETYVKKLFCEKTNQKLEKYDEKVWNLDEQWERKINNLFQSTYKTI